MVLFAASQLSARVLVKRVGAKPLMTYGIALSTVGLLLLTRLSETSGYPELLATLVLFGAGNGLAFVPLTAAALHGVDPADAGAASGLVNVMQQVGGALGLAVLVALFGTASGHADVVPGATAAAQAQHAFVVGTERAFLAAAVFLALTVALVAVVVRTPAGTAPVRAEVAEHQPDLDAPPRVDDTRGGAQREGPTVDDSEHIDDLVDTHPDWRGQTMAAARRVILAADPAITEAWKYMGAPVWELDGPLVVGNIFTAKVKLGFSYGAALDDPTGLFNGELGGNQRRSYELSEGDTLHEDALAELVRAAVARNRAARAARKR